MGILKKVCRRIRLKMEGNKVGKHMKVVKKGGGGITMHFKHHSPPFIQLFQCAYPLKIHNTVNQFSISNKKSISLNFKSLKTFLNNHFQNSLNLSRTISKSDHEKRCSLCSISNLLLISYRVIYLGITNISEQVRTRILSNFSRE